MRCIGAQQYRIYDQTVGQQLDPLLTDMGYTRSEEVGLVSCERYPSNPSLQLQPIVNDDDWSEKLALHSCGGPAPDGHHVSPERWVQMERRKEATGKLQFFLARWDGKVCGTVGVINGPGFIRMKNLWVTDAFRGRGVGSAITMALVNRAIDSGYRALGLVALADGPALPMYLRLGMRPVARLIEWVRPV